MENINEILVEHLIQKYLFRDIRKFNDLDNEDRINHYNISIEFSKCNRDALFLEFSNYLSKKIDPITIVEIGVARISTKDYKDCSTKIFLDHKRKEDTYVGIDIEDKSFLRNFASNVHTLQCNSENYDFYRNYFSNHLQFHKTEIDFLFIDGWHSRNQVLKELFYVNLVNKGGVIGYHDTNYHPGPSSIINAFNDNFSAPRKYCLGNDWGISFITKLV